MSDNRNGTRPKRGRVLLTLTLRDGQAIKWEGQRCPKAWKSTLMQLAPYGTDYAGAQYSRTRL